ncbi:hypothetical protein N0V94_001473 [Neodidymelliopsis sp. IMI 364377]|nr:hypothetical protein N0V94_001473 [Neodidymelliopsis sp. IMI 364377]
MSEATLSLKTAEETTAHQYRKLAEDVKRFDPAPWVTHVGPPNDAEFDDPIAQVRDIAEIVRNLDTFVEDPGLQALDDSFTVLLWALKDSNEIQVIEGESKTAGCLAIGWF